MTIDLSDIATAAGLDPSESRVQFSGVDDPIFPSPLRLGAATAGVLGMVGAAINDISVSGGGRQQQITVDRVHALMTISSLWLLTVDGEPAMRKFTPAQIGGDGIYRCRDGKFVHLMNAFPHLTNATLQTLDANAGTIREVIAGTNSVELEARLVEAGLPGVVVRDHDTWLETPQGALLRDAPAVTITRVGDAPPTPLPEGPEPLGGLHMLDATRVLAGPTCGRTIAAFGADVLHVGSPTAVDLVAAQVDTGSGKRRAVLDLDSEAGRQSMWRLIDGADVFSQSYRAGSLARRGYGVEAVVARRPGIVYVTETAYGNFGPWQTKRGFDSNVQAASGIFQLHENPAEPAAADKMPMAMNDYCTGYWGAYGVLEALQRRAREGGSWHVEVSLAQTARWLMRLGTVASAAAEPSRQSLFELAERYAERVPSAYGELGRLKFPIAFSETTPRWSAPVWPGTDEPEWV